MDDTSTKKAPKVVLPYELERDIFELTTRAYPAVGPKLSLVSRYVQEWVELVLYETIVLELDYETTEFFMRTFDARPASFFARAVKRLHITNMLSFEDARRLIEACSGAVEIGAWAYPNSFQDNFLPCINTCSLRRLSMPLEALWGNELRPCVFDPAMFPKLTHLEVVNPPGLWPPLQVDWDNMINLPSLTHLAFGELSFKNHKHYLESFKRVLEERQDLHVLVVFSSDEWIADEIEQKGLDQDARVVLRDSFVRPVSDEEYWREVRLGGADMWTRAEDMVHLQRDEIEKTRQILQELQDYML